MDAAHNIAKEIDKPDELDDGTLEMILFLTQKAISDLKELHQKNIYSHHPSPEDQAYANSPDGKIKQVK